MAQLKTQYVLGLVASVEDQANNRTAANALSKALEPLKDRMKHKAGLGLNPTADKAPAVIASVKSAIAAHNAAVQISIPSDEDILAGLAASDDATPTEL